MSGWSFESVTAIACDACSSDSACTGWRTDDNKTATLLTGHISASSDDCVGGKKHYSHHGGSGTTHCALRAGRPTVVTPVFLDQFTYRRLVTSLGCGVGSERLNTLTSTKLAAAIREAGAAPMMARAKEVGERMRAEDGNAAAVAAIEKHLEEKVRTGAWKKDFDARVVVPAMDGVAQPLLQA